MSVKFIYRRYITKATEQDAARGLRMSISCKGGIAVGYIWDEAKKKLRVSVARCCTEDNFNKRIARAIVIGRLVSNRPNRSTEIDLEGVTVKTPQQVEEIVWGWLENKERIWDAEIVSHSVH